MTSAGSNQVARFKKINRDWIGSIPVAWDAAMLKLVARLESGHTPSRSVPEYWENCTIPWFSLADVWQLREERRKFVYDTAEKVSELGVANSSARILPAGTVMLSRTASVGFTGIMGQDMATTQDFVNWVCGDKILPTYLWYCLQAMTPEYDRLRFGSTHQTIYMPDVAQFKVPVPPRDVQGSIANFLDEQTARIDALIAEKERLAVVLRDVAWDEVTRAVTRGVKSAKTRKSGLDWCPEVPAHWDVLLLRRLFARTEYGISESMDAEGPVAVLRMGNIAEGKVLMTDLKYVNEVTPELLLQPGDVLYNRTNSLAQVAKVGVVRDVPEMPVTFASYLVRLVPNDRVLPRYLGYLLNSPDVLAIARSLALPAIGQANLNPNRYGYIHVPCPPITEQLEIVAHLDKKVADIEGLAKHTAEHIERLREYRSSLISAAVTGQLDINTYRRAA